MLLLTPCMGIMCHVASSCHCLKFEGKECSSDKTVCCRLLRLAVAQQTCSDVENLCKRGLLSTRPPIAICRCKQLYIIQLARAVACARGHADADESHKLLQLWLTPRNALWNPQLHDGERCQLRAAAESWQRTPSTCETQSIPRFCSQQ